MKITLTVDNRIKVQGILNAVQSDKFWHYAAVQWHRLYKDWVPMKEGALYNQVTFAPKEITHNVPYAHYQYEGKVYGPNFPIVQGGAVSGFFSLRNRPKHPTGGSLKHVQQLHPKACAKWDQAAAPTQLPKLVQELQNFVDSGGLDIK